MAGSTSYYGGSYTTQDLEELQRRVDEANKQLQNFNTNLATDEELRKRAENEYNPLYNAQVAEQEALKRSAQSAYDERLGALARQYEKNQEQTNRNYDTQRVTANNTMLGRGMNNSSLALAMLNRVEDQRNRALNDLSSERNAYETSARNDYTNALTTADAAIARLGSDRATNVDARFQALRDAEQQRAFQAKQAQNQLTQYVTDMMVQIEALRQQGYSQYLQQQNAEADRALQQAQQQLAQQQAEWDQKYKDQQLAWQKEQAEKDRELEQAKQQLAEKEFEWNKEFNQSQFDWEKEQANKKHSSGGGGSSSNKGTTSSAGATSNKSGGTITGAVKGLVDQAKEKVSGFLGALGNALKNSKTNSNATSSTAKKATSSTTNKKTGGTGSFGSKSSIKKGATVNQFN